MAAAGVGVDVEDLATGCGVAPDAGPVGEAPATRPCEAGSMYAVAETLAVICGKPRGPAARLIALRVISRPRIEI